MREETEIASGEPRWGQLVLGLGVLLVGLLLLVDRLELGPDFPIGRLWPVIVVVVGLGHFRSGAATRDQRSGLIITGIGVWLLLASLELFGFHFGNSWPLVIVAVGLASLLRPGEGEDRWSGLAMIALGTVFLVVTRGWFDLDWSTGWPLLLILAGVVILAKSLTRQGRTRNRRSRR